MLRQKHTAFRVCPGASRENRRMVHTQKSKLTTYTRNGAERKLRKGKGWIRMNNMGLNHLYIYSGCSEHRQYQCETEGGRGVGLGVEGVCGFFPLVVGGRFSACFFLRSHHIHTTKFSEKMERLALLFLQLVNLVSHPSFYFAQ